MLQYLIVVPCYNEEKRLPVSEFLSFMNDESNAHLDFLFVNDGSNDKTWELLQDISSQSKRANALNLETNRGKAEAIRTAVWENRKTDYDYIGFIDADLAIPLNELNHFIRLAGNEKQYSLISAARVQLLGYSEIKKTLIRHIIGRTFATVVSSLLSLPIYDTQCGAKLYKREMIEEVFKETFISKWLFDVEILFRMKKLVPQYEKKILEVPLRKCINPEGSKISTGYFFKAPFDLLKIYRKYRKG